MVRYRLDGILPPVRSEAVAAMKVRVAYTTTVSDDFRRAIRLHYGKEGRATRAEVAAWFKQYGSSEDENIMWELQQSGQE